MPSKSYMPALTGIRAIAALLVFLHHYNAPVFPSVIGRIFRECHIGVNIFFVLSGFLIYYRYYDHVQPGRPWLGAYFKNRIARIYPVLFLLTIASFIYAARVAPPSPLFYGDTSRHTTLLLLNLTFLKGFCSHLCFTGIAQSWTLTIEECFYIAAPLLFLLIKKDKRGFIFLPVLIVAAGFLLNYLFHSYAASTHGFYSDKTFMLLYTFNGRCLEFFIGMWLAKKIMEKGSSYIPGIRYTFSGFAIMLCALAILCSFTQTNKVINGMYHPIGLLADHILFPIGVALFFYGLIREQTYIRTFLASRPMVLLGKSSYAFYLIHVGFIALMLSPYAARFTPVNSIGYIAIMFLLLNLISILIFRFVEEPLNHAIRKIRFKRRSNS